VCIVDAYHGIIPFCTDDVGALLNCWKLCGRIYYHLSCNSTHSGMSKTKTALLCGVFSYSIWQSASSAIHGASVIIA
jgi:hypothetical protein